jgi:hypothetical protein
MTLRPFAPLCLAMLAACQGATPSSTDAQTPRLDTAPRSLRRS